MKEERTILYKELALKHNITMTIHAPYYVCLESTKTEAIERSKLEMKKAYHLAAILRVKRIIFQPGGGYKDRKEGL